MKSYIEKKQLGSTPMRLTRFCITFLPILLLPHAAAKSASIPIKPHLQEAHANSQPLGKVAPPRRSPPPPTTRRRRRTGQTQLQQERTPNLDATAAVGNSFIMLKSPVHKVASIPQKSDDDMDSTSSNDAQAGRQIAGLQKSKSPKGVVNATVAVSHVGSLPREHPIWDAVGLRAAHHWMKKLGSFSSQTDVNGDGSPWLQAVRYSSFGCITAAITGTLLAYLTFVVVRQWRKHILLRTVETKFFRENEYFLGVNSDQPLCLCCLEFIHSGEKESVTYLCGHGFHVRCVNDWNRKHSRNGQSTSTGGCTGTCPICPGRSDLGGSASKSSDEETPAANANAIEPQTGERVPVEIPPPGASTSSSDCARLFMLQNLSERYPGIMTKEELDRCAALPTAVLMSDIRFARQCRRSQLHSIFG